MLYRRRGKRIVIEKQLLDPRDMLDRLRVELNIHCYPDSCREGRAGLRPALFIAYSTKQRAKAAEKWIDEKFEI